MEGVFSRNSIYKNPDIEKIVQENFGLFSEPEGSTGLKLYFYQEFYLRRHLCP